MFQSCIGSSALKRWKTHVAVVLPIMIIANCTDDSTDYLLLAIIWQSTVLYFRIKLQCDLVTEKTWLLCMESCRMH